MTQLGFIVVIEKFAAIIRRYIVYILSSLTKDKIREWVSPDMELLCLAVEFSNELINRSIPFSQQAYPNIRKTSTSEAIKRVHRFRNINGSFPADFTIFLIVIH